MTAWTEITALETDPGKPGKSELIKALAINPIAIAEGVDNAPKISSEAMGLFQIERLTPGNVTGLNLDRVASLMVMASVISSAGNLQTVTSQVTYQLSSNNGSSFFSAVTIATVTSVNTAEQGGQPIILQGSDVRFIDMTGFNAIRFSTTLGGRVIAIGLGRSAP